MKNILLIISFIILTLGCKKEEIEVVLEPTFELTLNGRDIDPVAFYRVINTYGGIKTQNGVKKKLLSFQGLGMEVMILCSLKMIIHLQN